MIATDTVITIEKGFCVADKVRLNQKLRNGEESFSIIRNAHSRKEDTLITIYTDYSEISVSKDQNLLAESCYVEAGNIREGDRLCTVNGYETVKRIENVIAPSIHFTTDRGFIGNTFYLK